MFRSFLVMMVMVLVAAEGWCGAGYDACQQEERLLRANEAEQCSGVGYIFNPSACFNTRKALTPYTKGKCRTIAATEGVEPKSVVPAKPVFVTPPVQPARVTYEAAEVPAKPKILQTAPVSPAVQPTEVELLRGEIAELRKELEKLKEEVNVLRGAK